MSAGQNVDAVDLVKSKLGYRSPQTRRADRARPRSPESYAARAIGELRSGGTYRLGAAINGGARYTRALILPPGRNVPPPGQVAAARTPMTEIAGLQFQRRRGKNAPKRAG